jgi:hypothetical protein
MTYAELLQGHSDAELATLREQLQYTAQVLRGQLSNATEKERESIRVHLSAVSDELHAVAIELSLRSEE